MTVAQTTPHWNENLDEVNEASHSSLGRQPRDEGETSSFNPTEANSAASQQENVRVRGRSAAINTALAAEASITGPTTIAEWKQCAETFRGEYIARLIREERQNQADQFHAMMLWAVTGGVFCFAPELELMGEPPVITNEMLLGMFWDVADERDHELVEMLIGQYNLGWSRRKKELAWRMGLVELLRQYLRRLADESRWDNMVVRVLVDPEQFLGFVESHRETLEFEAKERGDQSQC